MASSTGSESCYCTCSYYLSLCLHVGLLLYFVFCIHPEWIFRDVSLEFKQCFITLIYVCMKCTIPWSSKFYSAIHWLCICISPDFICKVILSAVRTYWYLQVITGLQFSTPPIFSKTLKHMLKFNFSSGKHAIASFKSQHCILSIYVALSISLNPTKAKIKHVLKCLHEYRLLPNGAWWNELCWPLNNKKYLAIISLMSYRQQKYNREINPSISVMTF